MGDEAPADDLPAGNPTPKTLDKESGGDDPADADRDKAAADDLPAGNLTPKTPDEESGGDDPADDDDSTTSPTTQAVCKIDKIDDTYYYSTLDDAITAATDGDQIDLLANPPANALPVMPLAPRTQVPAKAAPGSKPATGAAAPATPGQPPAAPAAPRPAPVPTN